MSTKPKPKRRYTWSGRFAQRRSYPIRTCACGCGRKFTRTFIQRGRKMYATPQCGRNVASRKYLESNRAEINKRRRLAYKAKCNGTRRNGARNGK